MAESEGSKNLRKLIKDVDKVLQIAKNIKKDIEEIMPAEKPKDDPGKSPDNKE